MLRIRKKIVNKRCIHDARSWYEYDCLENDREIQKYTDEELLKYFYDFRGGVKVKDIMANKLTNKLKLETKIDGDYFVTTSNRFVYFKLFGVTFYII